MTRYPNSQDWLTRARSVMPCDGAQTLSKGPSRNPESYPAYIDRGKGPRVWDVDGNSYVDYMSALGPIILGYSDPRVNKAVVERVEMGNLFSLESPPVVEVAERLTTIIPGAEAVRFVKSGSDAVSAAVRVARTYTGRDLVLVAGNSYHGSHNWFQVTQELGRNGVPGNERQNIQMFEYNSLTELAGALNNLQPVAAVVIEPARDFTADLPFLQGAKRLCEENGALLIFDEVVTFGRWPGLTYARHSGITPDLMALGKALANGYPLGACVGRRDVMDAFERCFISGTYNGELTAMAAAKATMDVLTSEPVVDHIWRQGRKLMYGFNEAMREHGVPGEAKGHPSCHRYTFTGPRAQELKLRFMAECASRGVLPGLITYPTYAHTDADVDRTVKVFHDVAGVLEKELWA